MPDIRHALQIAVPPDAVYPLVATAKGFAQWWAADITEPEGAVSLSFFNRTTVYRVRLQLDRPPLQAEWLCESGQEWQGTRLVFQLAAGGPGTVLRFAHAGWQAETDYFVSCNTTWGALLFRLKAAAEGRPRGPLFLANGMAD